MSSMACKNSYCRCGCPRPVYELFTTLRSHWCPKQAQFCAERLYYAGCSTSQAVDQYWYRPSLTLIKHLCADVISLHLGNSIKSLAEKADVSTLQVGDKAFGRPEGTEQKVYAGRRGIWEALDRPTASWLLTGI